MVNAIAALVVDDYCNEDGLERRDFRLISSYYFSKTEKSSKKKTFQDKQLVEYWKWHLFIFNFFFCFTIIIVGNIKISVDYFFYTSFIFLLILHLERKMKIFQFQSTLHPTPPPSIIIMIIIFVSFLRSSCHYNQPPHRVLSTVKKCF